MGVMNHSCMQGKRNLRWLGLVSMLNWTALFLSVFLLSDNSYTDNPTRGDWRVGDVKKYMNKVNGCYGHKLQLYPNVTELEINEGDALKIKCTSNDYVEFYYPDTYYLRGVMMSDYEIYPEEKSRRKTFLRESTVVGDTGWYGCANINKKITHKTSKDMNDPSVRWMYVYVKSKESAFIQSNWYALPPMGCLPYFAIFPCRTTSPGINVTLTTSDPNLQRIINRNAFFDPRIGFVLKNLNLFDPEKQFNSIFCEVKNDDFTDKTMVFPKSYFRNCINEPTIKIEGKNKVFMGSTLSMTCTVKIYVENQIQESQNSNVDLITSKLVIKNVTNEDEGNYTCQVRSSFNEHRSTNIFIKVHDTNPYISLSSENSDKAYVIGDLVMLTAHVDAYPPPTLTWLTSNGTEIVFGKKFRLPRFKRQYPKYPESNLMISDVQMEDQGVYTLRANNSNEIKLLNFSVTVYEKPRVVLNQAKLKSYYGFNKTTTFSCQAAGYPPPNISWFYKMCPDYYLINNCNTVKMEGEPGRNEMYSELKVNMESFGKIICKACHAYDCDSEEYNTQITDGVDDAPYGIIGPEEAYDGENVTLICAAVKHDYLSVTWLDDSFNKISNSAKVQVASTKTKFTIRKELVIYNISQSDEKDYHCSVMSDIKSTKTISFYLNVKLQKKPYFITDNMNATNVTVLTTDARNAIHLYCFVGGTPAPKITWYKNDALLNLPEDRFSLFSNDQKLIIRYLEEDDSGNYSCRAENRFGKVEKYQRVNVTEIEYPSLQLTMIVWFIIILILLSIYLRMKVQNEKMMREQLLKAGLAYFEEGAIDLINPELTVNDQAEYLPYDKKWEFPRKQLKLGQQLGSGAFGVVVKAEAFGICATEPVTTVAVKMVHENAESVYIRALVRELKIMMHLGQHLNIVNLLGACTKNIDKREFLVILESCDYGNLQDYLRYHRGNFVNQIDPSTGDFNWCIQKKVKRAKRVSSAVNSYLEMACSSNHVNLASTKTQNSRNPMEFRSSSYYDDLSWRSNYEGNYENWKPKCICSHDLLSWAYQVANGMEYLSKKKVLHCDLAARNILLSTNNIVKICDFGLAQTLYKDINYTRLHDVKLPFKWMAIESLRDGVFSTKSDIWSFGIVIWEFFTLAEPPYLGMGAFEVYQKLIDGYRMRLPKYATKYLYNIMLNCWEDEPTLRPSFTKISESIGMLLDKRTRMHFQKSYHEYENINTEADLKRENDYLANMSSPDHVALALPQQDHENGLLQGYFRKLDKENGDKPEPHGQ
ncbi:vascular endothelial growth factor receptor kdr-like [Copidosoma floridanum]|uniref:vascular endothelial growth factor receptor kdr-like n=1 Tax=Copidosoma floridanum TaxID=29053 RepID=UPI000C6F7964|nr:vascular endothelial growth factor receptor kdr-like [Copidosoma floridanum]